MTPSINVTVLTIGSNLNTFLGVFWPYILAIMVGILLVLVAASIGISAVLSLSRVITNRREGGVHAIRSGSANPTLNNRRYYYD